ncbi:glycoside hydrolase family 16 protein [Phycomyces blakesleeanus NRRL 1555(-)]|uniref:Glycoside hydrolase family 16 protein n=1 Tax=Phycomyces blakesleeanus (strain ATCC 8743b / DSM 1359 / FGSC 10004 / NBRC 33097 / NRRL 1555) TaxID=763407 RepID=A0A162U990_PHYB8|nr:glycoside hydrolase family 16 protein [Phycomyces blakesleeanus NRRL 1555(-)]OAD74512.1 glycoside hydrolase family 16 protein [Phycomyces blakesleeanus NRRL 1555(-)]|eukprot:XP_018292552.1 glycoside hydrolase family 16 protein [Phycomyces blakesleeanus NRRL 1555(-)]
MCLASFTKAQTFSEDAILPCQNLRSEFSETSSGWIAHSLNMDTYEITPSDGIKMVLLPPKKYIRHFDESVGKFLLITKLPYNEFEGVGPTFNSTNYMKYGRFSATVRSAPVGGAVTAMILMADGGDEIDYEILGGDPNHVQTNYFYGGKLEYIVNGGLHEVSGEPIFDAFHTYTIDWSPERIVWEVDGIVVRTREKKDTCEDGVCKYPTHAARVQLGLWDGSTKPGTAQWARGPIDWSLHSSVNAYVKNVVLECDSRYNSIMISENAPKPSEKEVSISNGTPSVLSSESPNVAKKEIAYSQPSQAFRIPLDILKVGLLAVSLTFFF